MESDEHIYFKNLIAEIGNRLGYSVALKNVFVQKELRN